LSQRGGSWKIIEFSVILGYPAQKLTIFLKDSEVRKIAGIPLENLKTICNSNMRQLKFHKKAFSNLFFHL
jgi:hypothetical protein